MTTARAVLCAVGLFLLAVAPAAGAQEPSPQVDRGSPAGIEYQLPIQRAREKATGDAPGASSGTAPRFGVGIEKPAGKRAGGRRDRAKVGATAPEEPRGGASPPQIVRTQAAAAGDGGGGLLRIAAAGASALLLGALAGLCWRRGRTVRR